MQDDTVRRIQETGNTVKENVERVIVGKSEVVELVIVTLLCEGHILIDDVPGIGKTMLAKSIARSLGCSFRRIQFTPDLLPSDITGTHIFNQKTSDFELKPGPVMAQVLLADEINRATPRTQSALLEAMQESQVTIERETHRLEPPFLVIAAQLPRGGAGTSPLTEVQVDRFMFRVWSAYPDRQEEDQIIRDIDQISEPHISVIATPEDIIQLQQEVKKVHIADGIRHYITNILDNLRRHQDLSIGPSPRGSIALLQGSRGLAFVQGRDFVTPDDVKRLLIPTLSHRLRISAEAEMEDVTPEAIINQVASETPVPKI